MTHDSCSSPTYHLQPTNYLYFQQHSRFQRVSTFIFIDIPASPWAAESRPFVFIDIPASLVHFLKSLVLSSPVGGDILSRAAPPAKSPLHHASLKFRRQSAVSRRRSAVARSKKATHNPIHNSEFSIAEPERLSPESRILNPVFSTTPLTILAYLLPPVKRHRVRVGPAREARAPTPGVIRAEEWQWSRVRLHGRPEEEKPQSLWQARLCATLLAC